MATNTALLSEDQALDLGGIKVNFRRHRFARRITIKIQPFKAVTVTIPLRASFDAAHAFVLHKEQWIRASLEKMRKIEEREAQLSKNLPKIDLTAAAKLLHERTAFLAQRNGFAYNRIVIRRQKTLRGSCSVKKDISLNAALAALPQEVMDYVIIHELMHTLIRNHGKEFWRRVVSILPQAPVLRRRLRGYRHFFLC
jgi:predicted metal-dependent hydrolase